MTQPSPDPRAAIAVWWRNANKGTQEKARLADYYSSTPLPPDLVATLARAGVVMTDAHLVAPPGRRRGYYLDDETSAALRALDGSPQGD